MHLQFLPRAYIFQQSLSNMLDEYVVKVTYTSLKDTFQLSKQQNFCYKIYSMTFSGCHTCTARTRQSEKMYTTEASPDSFDK